MALPSNVQRQLDAAEALLAQANAPQEPPAPASPEPLAEPPVESQAPEAPPQQPAAPVAPASPVVPASEYEEIVAKYRALQGMHRGYQAKIDQLQGAVQTLQTQLQSAAKPAAPEPEKHDTTKDAEVFGGDLVDMVKRVAQGMFGEIARQFGDRLAAIEQRLEGTSNSVAQTAQEVFLSRLAAQVPNFSEVNTSQGFLAWLSEVDPVYGAARQDALTAAGNALDADRVAAIFKAYLATLAPPAQAAAAPAEALNRQVAPRPGASAPQAAPQKRAVSAASIEQFYNDVRRGAYRGREDEAQAIEAQINAALAEGRVI